MASFLTETREGLCTLLLVNYTQRMPGRANNIADYKSIAYDCEFTIIEIHSLDATDCAWVIDKMDTETSAGKRFFIW